MELPNLPFVATKFCALCREVFPPQRLRGIDAWQSSVRAVVCLDTNGDSIELTNLVYLPDMDDDLDVPLIGPSQPQTITICRDARESQGVAFCFHGWCYSILAWKLKDCPKSVIYKLARTLTPDTSNARSQHYDLDSASKLQLLVDSRSQPQLISRLPAELKMYIWRYIGFTTLYSAFIIVASETYRLAHHLRCPSSCEIIVEQGSYLSWQMITVFGTESLQNLIINENREGDSKFLGDITAVKYVWSLGGICAVQLLGVNWESSWIGKIPNAGCTWYGMVRGRIFRCEYNDLTCALISPSRPFSTTPVVWDRPDFPSTLLDPNSALFDFDRDVTNPVNFNSIVEVPRQLFFRYLSLCYEKEYASGLTVYVATHGIVGLEAYFRRTSQLSGSRYGCALYFPLYPQERIVYTWLRIVNSISPAFAAPALTIQTTRGRIHTFGSFILPCLVVENAYNWILLKTSKWVSGLYYENPNPRTTIMRLGVVGDGPIASATPLLPQYYDCDFPFPLIGSPNAGLFLSVAALNDLERVDLCHVDNRCTGMLIYYLDGHSAVLGQWQSSPFSRCSCIYNSSRPSITKIYFKLSKFQSHQVVADVSFSPDTNETTSACEYRGFTVGEHIAWWFTERYDTVLSWKADIRNIPDMSALN